MAVVAVADAREYLRITGTTYDDMLEDLIDAAEATIAQRCGPLEAVEVAERVRGGVDSFALRVTPAIEVTELTVVEGDEIDPESLYVDGLAGVVAMNDGSAFGARAYDITYSAGRAVCPVDLVLAVKELVRHSFAAQRGAARVNSPQSDGTSNTLPGAAYLLPFRVSELIAPYLQAGFA